MSGFDPRGPQAPVVTDINREWAMQQKPSDWNDELLPWEQHVAEQAERFEAYFADDRKPQAEWQGLWRRVWWPKADPAVLHPQIKLATRHPFVRRGHQLWQQALNTMTERERLISEICGVAQFNRDDPRAAILTGGER